MQIPTDLATDLASANKTSASAPGVRSRTAAAVVRVLFSVSCLALAFRTTGGDRSLALVALLAAYVALAGLAFRDRHAPRIRYWHAMVPAVDAVAVFVLASLLDGDPFRPPWGVPLTAGIAVTIAGALVAPPLRHLARQASLAERERANFGQEQSAKTSELAEARGEIERLTRLQRDKDGLLESVVHDMRSPVSAAILSLEYLDLELRKGPDQAPLLEAIDDALGTLASLSGMISQVMDTLRLESRRLSLHAEATDVHGLLERAAEAAGARARSRAITIECDVSPGLEAIVDERLFPKVVDILLAYCLRHAPQGGRVLLSASRDAADTRIRVQASGKPIPIDERERMFDRFPFKDGENKRCASWALGLFFCRWLVSAHRGTIAVEDADGWGVSFVVRLDGAAV